MATTKNETKGKNDWTDEGAPKGPRLAGDEAPDGVSNAANPNGPAELGPTDDADPVVMEQHLDQAARRHELTNMQTDWERDTGRDGVSGTLNPGVTEHTSQTAGGPKTDMSGRPAFSDPLKALDPEALHEARAAMQKAEDQDIANAREGNEAAARRSAGWRSARDLPGVHQATLDALEKAGKVEVGHAPGMHMHVDNGKLYRIMKNRD